MEWNSKEKKELIKLYPKYTAKELEVKFKRSSKAIHRMANLLGIYKTANKVPPGLYDVGLRFMTARWPSTVKCSESPSPGSANRYR